MKIYKIRDSKTGEFVVNSSITSNINATVWFDLKCVRDFLRILEKGIAMNREVYSGYGEEFSGPLLPSTWQIVEFSTREINSTPVSELTQ